VMEKAFALQPADQAIEHFERRNRNLRRRRQIHVEVGDDLAIDDEQCLCPLRGLWTFTQPAEGVDREVEVVVVGLQHHAVHEHSVPGDVQGTAIRRSVFWGADHITLVYSSSKAPTRQTKTCEWINQQILQRFIAVKNIDIAWAIRGDFLLQKGEKRVIAEIPFFLQKAPKRIVAVNF